MRYFRFMLLSIFILAGCTEKDEVPIEEPETEAGQQEAEVIEEDTETESEEVSNEGDAEDTASENEAEPESKQENSKEAEPEPEPSDLLKDVSVVEGQWINYSGVDDARGHMIRTELMPYNPGNDYTITVASYVSYYYGNEFIKTNNYGHGGPYIIENVPEADQMIISFDEAQSESIRLINEAVDDSAADDEVNTTPEELVGQGRPVEDELTGTIMFGQEFLVGDDVTTGERIDDDGKFVEDANYYVTGGLSYSSSQDYVITAPAYISYYNGRRFIETVEIKSVPAYLPQVGGANYINISFHDDYILDLNMIKIEE